jgi:hypothetical protein
MVVYLVAAAVLLVKFLVYAAYAGALNRRFGTSHRPWRVSGVRMLLSLVFTAANAGFFIGLAHVAPAAFEAIAFSPFPLVTAIGFALLAWYIVLRIFFTTPTSSSADFHAALWLGTLISAMLAGLTFVLSMFGLMSSINIC